VSLAGGSQIGQAPAKRLTGFVVGASARFAERWDEMLGRSAQAPDGGDGTLACRRRRLSGDALIEREVGLGLAEKVPVRHRLRSIVPCGRSAGGRDWPAGAASAVNATTFATSAMDCSAAVVVCRVHVSYGSEAD
jgi:hypothetical protein